MVLRLANPLPTLLPLPYARAEPSKDITGGVWYNEAELDLDLISKIKRGAVSAVAAHGNVATPAQVRACGWGGRGRLSTLARCCWYFARCQH
jgi:hypothetical protein